MSVFMEKVKIIINKCKCKLIISKLTCSKKKRKEKLIKGKPVKFNLVNFTPILPLKCPLGQTQELSKDKGHVFPEMEFTCLFELLVGDQGNLLQ